MNFSNIFQYQISLKFVQLLYNFFTCKYGLRDEANLIYSLRDFECVQKKKKELGMSDRHDRFMSTIFCVLRFK